MNILSVLPVRSWGKKEEIRAIWEATTSILVTNSGVYCLSFLRSLLFLDEVSLQVCPEETMKSALSVITLTAEGLLAAAAHVRFLSDNTLLTFGPPYFSFYQMTSCRF